MSNLSQADTQFSSIRLIKILVKWRKQLLYVFIGSAILSFIISLPVFMKPMFKSYSVIYPANLQPYSKETPTEQLIQLLNSTDVRDSLIKKYGLYNHYDIDSTGAYPRFEIYKRMEENISISKTQYESVEIDVYDTDPAMAAALCDDLIKFTDKKAISLIHERAKEQLVINSELLIEKKQEMESMDDSISELRKVYGIMDYESQVQGFSREYFKYLGSGSVNAKLDQARKNLEEKGSSYVTYRENQWRTRGAYNDYKLKNDIISSDLHKELSFHNMVTPPSVPQKKDSPKRAMFMFLFTLTTMFIAVLVILYQEQIHQRLKADLSDIK